MVARTEHSSTLTIRRKHIEYAKTTLMVGVWAYLTYAAAFRVFGTGRDYYDYLDYYNGLTPYFSFGDTRFEPGFHLISWISANILKLNYDWLYLGLVGFSLGVKFFLIRKNLSMPILAMIAYVLTFYPLQEYTQIRAGVSMAFGYLAIHKFLNKRYIVSSVVFFMGVMFHYSEVVLIGCFFGSQFLRLRGAVVLLSIMAVLFIIFGQSLFYALLDFYTAINPTLTKDLSGLSLDQANFFSVNNILLICSIVSAVLCGWYSFGRYHATFLTLAIGSVGALAIFINSPATAQRTKEILQVSTVFLMYRLPFTPKTAVPIMFSLANAAVLFYVAISTGVLGAG